MSELMTFGGPGRFAFVTGDADASARFYREALGLEVTYDYVTNYAAGGLLGYDGPVQARMVSMRGGGDVITRLGMLQIGDPPVRREWSATAGSGVPPAVLVLESGDFAPARERALTAGAKLLRGPQNVDLPGLGGGEAFTLSEPHGAVVLVLSPAASGGSGAQSLPLIRGLIRVLDAGTPLDGVRAFYDKVLGFNEVGHGPIAPATAAVLGLPEGSGWEMSCFTAAGAPTSALCFLGAVDARRTIGQSQDGLLPLCVMLSGYELEAIAERARERGARVLFGPEESMMETGGRSVPFTGISLVDPAGVMLEVRFVPT